MHGCQEAHDQRKVGAKASSHARKGSKQIVQVHFSKITEQRVARFLCTASALEFESNRQASPSGVSKLGHCSLFLQYMFSFVVEEKNVSLDTCAARVATQSTDVPALVMRFCVLLLLNRGATWPSSKKP